LLEFKPDLWWSDGGAGMPIKEIRQLQPGILFNNRNESRAGDYATPEGNHMAVPKYMGPVVENGWWWESCEIFNGGSWHYSQKAERVSQTDRFLYRLAEVRSMGGNLLANIAPRPDGDMPEQAYRLFSELAEWMETGRESIYQINGGCGLDPDKANAPVTIRDQVWYVHARSEQATQQNPVVLSDMVKPAFVSLLRTGDELPYEFADGLLKLTVPGDLKHSKGTDVIKLVFDDAVVSEPYFFKNR
jgi:alpha-L-fucosidase